MQDQFHLMNWIEETQKFAAYRCMTFILFHAAVIFNVSYKSAKTHSSDTVSGKNIEHVAALGKHS